MDDPHIIPRPDDAPSDDASLQEVERWLRTRSTESGYGFDPVTGKKVWERHTDGDNVPLSAGDRQRLRGMIFTHNHPGGGKYPADDPRRLGSSFSPHDVHSSALSGMAELRAVSPGYIFTLRPKEGASWPAPEQIAPMVDVAAARHDAATLELRLRGMIDPRQIEADELHDIWTELAPIMGLAYRRERLA